ncbi:hypothetical protein AX15_002895 [Amanita polypyramis BW_CC]|nr:hypothetical protein AX15_002895 [Amanita polypyramis BW_CC]
MQPRFPLEIFQAIIHLLIGDVRTLKKVALVSRDFCGLAQHLLFSDIHLSGTPRKIKQLKKILLSQPRGERITSAITRLALANSFPSCQSPHLTGWQTLEYIAEKAQRLRVVHLGPFNGTIDWSELPTRVQAVLTSLLTQAENIILEGFENFPSSMFQQFRSVTSLDLSDVKLSWTGLKTPCARSLSSFAMHTGILGTSTPAHEDHITQYTSDFLRVLKSKQFFNFSSITTLYLQLTGPGASQLYREMFSLCKDTLESLRFYIFDDDEDSVIALSHLRSLKSLYMLINIKSPIRCLAKTLNTLTIPRTPLSELRLFIDTHEPDLADYTSGLVSGRIDNDDEMWKMLDRKLVQIFEARNDARVTLQLPARQQWDRVTVRDFLLDKFHSIEEYACDNRFIFHDFLYYNDFIKAHLTFRDYSDVMRVGGWIIEEGHCCRDTFYI